MAVDYLLYMVGRRKMLTTVKQVVVLTCVKLDKENICMVACG